MDKVIMPIVHFVTCKCLTEKFSPKTLYTFFNEVRITFHTGMVNCDGNCIQNLQCLFRRHIDLETHNMSASTWSATFLGSSPSRLESMDEECGRLSDKKKLCLIWYEVVYQHFTHKIDRP